MGHPFFEAPTFPWAHPLAAGFHDALVAAIDDVSSIVALFEDAGGKKADLATQKAPRLLWRDVLDTLTRESRLAALCDLLLKEPRPALYAWVRKLQAIQEASRRTVLHTDGQVFLDREELRPHIESLANPRHLVKVLVVSGARGSGRTWTRHLVSEAAAEGGDESLYYCEGTFGDVFELIEDLFDRVQGPGNMPDRPDTTSDAWYRRVCSKLQLAAQSHGKRYWIVVDDLDDDEQGAARLDARVRDFFDQFALLMVNDAYRKHFRLVLLAWPDGRTPTRWKTEHWRADKIHPGTIKERHIADYLGAWYGARGEAMTDTQRDEIAQRILAGATAAGGQLLGAIRDALLLETGQEG